MKRLARSNIRLREVAGSRFGHTGLATRTEGDLHRTVTVVLLRLNLSDAIGQCLNHGHRHCFAGIREDAGHAALATDQPQAMLQAHWVYTSLRPPTAIGRWHFNHRRQSTKSLSTP